MYVLLVCFCVHAHKLKWDRIRVNVNEGDVIVTGKPAREEKEGERKGIGEREREGEREGGRRRGGGGEIYHHQLLLGDFLSTLFSAGGVSISSMSDSIGDRDFGARLTGRSARFEACTSVRH